MNSRIQLVHFDNQCFELSQEWIADLEISRLIRAQTTTSEQRLTWFKGLPNRTDYKIWGVKFDGVIIGVCGLKNFEGQTTVEYWGYIGIKSLWGKGLGYEMLLEVFEKAKEMGYFSVWLNVSQSNARAIQLYERAGFKLTEVTEDFLKMSISL